MILIISIYILGAIFFIWLIYLFVKMSKRLDRIAKDSVSAAFYMEKALEFNYSSDRGKKYLSVALYFVKQGNIGAMPTAVISGYKSGEDYLAYLENYINKQLEER